ncbi:MAG: hypothetical protein WC058_08570 [Phycisphaeraceae bacterium]
MVQTDSGITAVNTNSIMQCTVDGATDNRHFEQTEKTPVLRMELKEPAPGKTRISVADSA